MAAHRTPSGLTVRDRDQPERDADAERSARSAPAEPPLLAVGTTAPVRALAAAVLLVRTAAVRRPGRADLGGGVDRHRPGWLSRLAGRGAAAPSARPWCGRPWGRSGRRAGARTSAERRWSSVRDSPDRWTGGKGRPAPVPARCGGASTPTGTPAGTPADRRPTRTRPGWAAVRWAAHRRAAVACGRRRRWTAGRRTCLGATADGLLTGRLLLTGRAADRAVVRRRARSGPTRGLLATRLLAGSLLTRRLRARLLPVGLLPVGLLPVWLLPPRRLARRLRPGCWPWGCGAAAGCGEGPFCGAGFGPARRGLRPGRCPAGVGARGGPAARGRRAQLSGAVLAARTGLARLLTLTVGAWLPLLRLVALLAGLPRLP